MEVDGFDRALERCLPVDDVDAMDDVGNAEVRVPSLADEEKLSGILPEGSVADTTFT